MDEGFNSIDTNANLKGISDFIDRIESRYVQKNFIDGSFIEKLSTFMESNFLSEELKSKYNDVFVSGHSDINKIVSSDRVRLILYCAAYNKLGKEQIKIINTNAMRLHANVNLQDSNVLSASFNNTMALLLINLHRGHYGQAVQNKMCLVMLMFFYQANKEQLVFNRNSQANISLILDVSNILLNDVFEYSPAEDMRIVLDEVY